MKYLVTGHTGFKGSWLSLWLAELGHEVIGLALDPLPGGLYESARVSEVVGRDVREDIRNADAVADVIRSSRPDVVIHLAAQPLVRESYRDPETTFSTNVLGTMSVLSGMRDVDSIRAAVIVTTDKVYRNTGQSAGYIESDPLGGLDPYSASKAMADLLTQSWIASFPGPPTAIARSGNVIGGGDVSPERLMPDLLNAYSQGRVPQLRYPEAVRPWQHVLDCLNGYLTLTDALLAGGGQGAWNFGPAPGSNVTVGEVARLVASRFGQPAEYVVAEGQPEEAGMLTLDVARASQELGWVNRLDVAEAVAWTAAFPRDGAGDPRAVALAQIRAFSGLA